MTQVTKDQIRDAQIEDALKDFPTFWFNPETGKVEGYTKQLAEWFARNAVMLRTVLQSALDAGGDETKQNIKYKSLLLDFYCQVGADWGASTKKEILQKFCNFLAKVQRDKI